MSAFSGYLASLVARFMFKNNSGGLASPGDSLYVALFTASTGLETNAPSAEVSGGAYARQQVAAAGWTEDGVGGIINANAINYAQATAAWGTISHAAIMDALTAGNVLYYGPLTAPTAVNNGDTYTIVAGDLAINHL